MNKSNRRKLIDKYKNVIKLKELINDKDKLAYYINMITPDFLDNHSYHNWLTNAFVLDDYWLEVDAKWRGIQEREWLPCDLYSRRNVLAQATDQYQQQLSTQENVSNNVQPVGWSNIVSTDQSTSAQLIEAMSYWRSVD